MVEHQADIRERQSRMTWIVFNTSRTSMNKRTCGESRGQIIQNSSTYLLVNNHNEDT